MRDTNMSQFFDWDTGAALVMDDKHGRATSPHPAPEPTTPTLLVKNYYRPSTRAQPRPFSAWPATYDQPDQQQSVTSGGGDEQNFWDSQRNGVLRQECQC